MHFQRKSSFLKKELKATLLLIEIFILYHFQWLQLVSSLSV